jgi:hypothetical protein
MRRTTPEIENSETKKKKPMAIKRKLDIKNISY